MPGNWHVRFLGGGGAVMYRCYPTVPVNLARKLSWWDWLNVTDGDLGLAGAGSEIG